MFKPVPRALASQSSGNPLPSDSARVGDHAGPCGRTKRDMPLMRLPGARIAVLTSSDISWQATIELLTHELNAVTRFQSADDLVRNEHPDIVVLDRGMLGEGALVLRRVRQQWLTCVLFVIGAADEKDAEQLLDIGADNVMRSGDPLLAPRLRAAARRARALNAATRTVVGDIMYDRESHRVWCAGQSVRLTRTEETMLDCLFWNAPHPVSVSALSSFGWRDDDQAGRSNRVHVYMGYLRRKLERSETVVIRMRRGAGYEFAERPDRSSPRAERA